MPFTMGAPHVRACAKRDHWLLTASTDVVGENHRPYTARAFPRFFRTKQSSPDDSPLVVLAAKPDSGIHFGEH